VLKHRVDLALIKPEPVATFWGFGAPVDEIDGAVGFLEVSSRLVEWIFTITPGKSFLHPRLREPLEPLALSRSS
jgi:hypothetical protein